jgi:two-component system phosphate regulon sensor histidine kinase PhoR
MEFTKFDLIKLTDDLVKELEFRAKESNVILTVRDPKMAVWVEADRSKISQVLTNLIMNSIKYSREEGGETRIKFYDMDENILVEVEDNGLGIAADHLPRLFERFYRIDKSRSRHQGGSGLGLAIVKHIIESHGQTINVRSQEGEGSTFSFTLKKAKPQ